MREARGAAEPGMQAEHHFRKTKAGAIDRNPRLAGERDFEAAAEAEAVDHRDARDFESFEAVDYRVPPANSGLDGPRIGGAAKFVDVGTGNETGFLRGANHKSRGALIFQRRQHGIEFLDDI